MNISPIPVLLSLFFLLISCNEERSKNLVQNIPHENFERYDTVYEDKYDSLIMITEYVGENIDGRMMEQNLWLKNKYTGESKKILSTFKPDGYSWYVGDGNRFIPVSMDSITWISRAFIHRYNPLKIIVEGCCDERNEFSYVIDVEENKAWWVPANNGYIGVADGLMIFRSYRYSSYPDEIGGVHAFLQLFDDKGIMVDSLDLEHVKLEKAGIY